MKKLLAVLEQVLSAGQDAVLVTVIASSGSTPRGAGARMLVTDRGWVAGTIGGGAVEDRCIRLARQRLGGAPCCDSFDLSPEDKAGLGMVCGGAVEVHFLPLSGGDEAVLALCRDSAQRFASGTPFWLLTPLDGAGTLTLWPRGRGESPCTPPAAVISALGQDPRVLGRTGERWFCEQVQHAGTVYLFGGGHVAQALVPVLAPLDFPSVIVEDREEFADPALFPLARGTRCFPMDRIRQELDITADDYVCIMTRGHQNDLLVQQQVLHTPARYIGLIGSTRKSAAAFASLRRMGYSEQQLRRIVTPIGLPIGGRTPAEIAISIAGQLIEYRAGGRRDWQEGDEL